MALGIKAKRIQPTTMKSNNFFQFLDDTPSTKYVRGFRPNYLATFRVFKGEELLCETEPFDSGVDPKVFYAEGEQWVRETLLEKGILVGDSEKDEETLKGLRRIVYLFWPKARERYEARNKEI